MRILVILLLSCAIAFAQTTLSQYAEQLVSNRDDIEILNDTQGVNFSPYLKSILPTIRQNWLRVIPPCALATKGELAIKFDIKRDGSISAMRLVATSYRPALDRAAWGAIVGSNPFPPLPSEFSGSSLALRMRFRYNPDKKDSEDSGKGCAYSTFSRSEGPPKTKSGIEVHILAPLPGELDVPLGGSKLVTALVTGTGTNENTVEWSVTGLGCSGATCGEMTKDSYRAPSVMPSPPYVTLTAASKADSAAKASVTLHIVEPSQSR